MFILKVFIIKIVIDLNILANYQFHVKFIREYQIKQIKIYRKLIYVNSMETNDNT
jgi:hypothetical protein